MPDIPIAARCSGLCAQHCHPAGHEPHRGDAVEAWLQRKLDEWPASAGTGHGEMRYAISRLLGDYRLHADTGTPLDGEVSE